VIHPKVQALSDAARIEGREGIYGDDVPALESDISANMIPEDADVRLMRFLNQRMRDGKGSIYPIYDFADELLAALRKDQQ